MHDGAESEEPVWPRNIPSITDKTFMLIEKMTEMRMVERVLRDKAIRWGSLAMSSPINATSAVSIPRSRAGSTHRNSYVRGSQGRSIVHAVADVSNAQSLALHASDKGQLLIGQRPTIVFINPHIVSHPPNCCHTVAADHDRLLNTYMLQSPENSGGLRTDRVGQGYQTDNAAAGGHQNGRIAFSLCLWPILPAARRIG